MDSYYQLLLAQNPDCGISNANGLGIGYQERYIIDRLGPIRTYAKRFFLIYFY